METWATTSCQAMPQTCYLFIYHWQLRDWRQVLQFPRAASLLAAWFVLLSSLAYSSTLRIEAYVPSKRRLVFSGSWSYIPADRPLVTAAMRTSVVQHVHRKHIVLLESQIFGCLVCGASSVLWIDFSHFCCTLNEVVYDADELHCPFILCVRQTLLAFYTSLLL
jgi:hypothetical protein